VKNALASLDFLVVTDMFLTETAGLATVVLPASSFAEKEGTFTNFEGRVQMVRKVIEPPVAGLADWQIILQLASRMGGAVPYSSPRQGMDEIEELVPLYRRPADNSFETEELERADLEGSRLGTRRLYQGLFPSGFERFSPAKPFLPPNTSGNGYPLTLLSGSIPHHFGSGTRSSRASRLKKFSPNGWVEISGTDAKHLGFSDGDRVRVVSPAGEVTTTVRVTDTLASGLLFMPMSFPESPANELFGITLDSQSKTPALKRCAVRLERTNADG